MQSTVLAVSLSCSLLVTSEFANPGPTLDLGYAQKTAFAKVEGATPDFLAALLVADSDKLVHYLVGLPPLLGDATLVGIGKATDFRLTFAVPVGPLPNDLKVFAQAVTLDEMGVSSSAVATIVLPASK